MKKLSLIFAGVFISAMVLTSCNSEEKVVEQNAATVEFAKTTEMLNFESALKDYMKYRHENTANIQTEKVKSESKKIIETDAKVLLTSLGTSETEIASKTNQSTEILVSIAMKAYSKKLTEMYNQQKNN
jgi:hypothetical protein